MEGVGCLLLGLLGVGFLGVGREVAGLVGGGGGAGAGVGVGWGEGGVGGWAAGGVVWHRFALDGVVVCWLGHHVVRRGERREKRLRDSRSVDVNVEVCRRCGMSRL